MNLTVHIQELLKRIEDQRAGDVDSIISGRMTDFSEYRYAAGHIHGLDAASAIINQLLEELTKG